MPARQSRQPTMATAETCGAVGAIDLGGRGMPRPYDIAFWRAARRDHRGYGQKGNHKGCPYNAIIGSDPTVED